MCVSITDKIFEDTQVVEVKTQVKFSNMYVKSKCLSIDLTVSIAAEKNKMGLHESQID